MSSIIKFMGAKAARNITESAEAVNDFRNHINKMICQAAKKGEYEVKIAFQRSGIIGHEITGILKEFKELGYNCESFNYNSGYLIINWKEKFENIKAPEDNDEKTNSNIKFYLKPSELNNISFKTQNTTPLINIINGKLAFSASVHNTNNKVFIHLDDVDRNKFSEDDVRNAINDLMKLGYNHEKSVNGDPYDFTLKW